MSPTRRTYYVAIALALLTLAAAVQLWLVAFPATAVRFPLGRAQERRRLDEFVQSMTTQPMGGYCSVMRFDTAVNTRYFLERQYGDAGLAAAARRGINVWHWTARWFKPRQREEYWAGVDQDGRVISYIHEIEEARAFPDIGEAAARKIAEAFLASHVTQHPLAALRYVESSTARKPRRTDYTFTWERDDLRMEDAPYDVVVHVQGGEVGSYHEYLKVPGWWSAGYERQRQVNELCAHVARFAFFAIAMGIVVAFIHAAWQNRIRWRDAIPPGWLMLCGAVLVASKINGIEESLFAYSTADDWGPFVAESVLNAGRDVMVQVLSLWWLALAVDPIYRRLLPGLPSFRRALGRHSLRDPHTVRALGAGILLAVFSLAYVTLFYSVGRRFGVWCPLAVNPAVNGPLPWIDPMLTGLSASFIEEFVFRVGGLLLLWRILRVRWLAALLSAAVWAFLHSTYAQMPGYTRGIELTISGFAWGWVMLRYGVVSTLAAHYLYDSWIGCIPIFQVGGWHDAAGAAVVALWPVALFLRGLCQRGRALEPEPEEIAALPVDSHPPPLRRRELVSLNLGRKGAILLMACCCAGLLLAWRAPKPQDPFEKLGALDLSRAQILARADAELAAKGYPPAGYERVISMDAHNPPAEYLLRHGDIARIAALYDRELYDITWHVRYFRFGQTEEFGITLDKHGNFASWSHTLLGEAPGGSLASGPALLTARAAMARTGRIHADQQETIMAAPREQEHRRDWTFGFDQRGFAWDEAKLRTYVIVQGAEAVGLSRAIWLPEAWRREQARNGWQKVILRQVTNWLAIAGGVLVAIPGVMALKRRLIPWRQALLLGLFPLALKVVDEVNGSISFYAGYDTSALASQYLAGRLASCAQEVAMAYIGGVLLAAAGLGLLRWAWGWTPDQAVLWPRDAVLRGRFLRDTLLGTLAGAAAAQVLDWINAEALGHFNPAAVLGIHYWSVDEWLPCVSVLTESLGNTYVLLLRVAVWASLVRLARSRWPHVAWGLLLFVPLSHLSPAESLGGFCWNAGYQVLTVVTGAWLVVKVWRFNVAAIFLALTLPTLGESTRLLLAKGGPVYRWQAAPILALGLVLLATAWVAHRRMAARAA